jgi:hypothetical protein
MAKSSAGILAELQFFLLAFFYLEFIVLLQRIRGSICRGIGLSPYRTVSG